MIFGRSTGARRANGEWSKATRLAWLMLGNAIYATPLSARLLPLAALLRHALIQSVSGFGEGRAPVSELLQLFLESFALELMRVTADAPGSSLVRAEETDVS